jgi:hypothetical protein
MIMVYYQGEVEDGDGIKGRMGEGEEMFLGLGGEGLMSCAVICGW